MEWNLAQVQFTPESICYARCSLCKTQSLDRVLLHNCPVNLIKMRSECWAGGVIPVKQSAIKMWTCFVFTGLPPRHLKVRSHRTPLTRQICVSAVRLFCGFHHVQKCVNKLFFYFPDAKKKNIKFKKRIIRFSSMLVFDSTR